MTPRLGIAILWAMASTGAALMLYALAVDMGAM